MGKILWILQFKKQEVIVKKILMMKNINYKRELLLIIRKMKKDIVNSIRKALER